jgi:hypothetical protein
MLRRVLATIAGIVAGGIVIMLVEMLSHRIYPPPPGIDVNNPEALKALMASAPPGALAAVVIAWALGSFAGGWTAAAIGKHLIPALIVGAVLMIGGVANMMMIPHPIWMWVAGLIVFLPGAFLGGKLGAPSAPEAPRA